MNLSQNIKTMIKYFGTDATFNGIPGRLIFDAPSMIDRGFVTGISSNKYTATMETSQWSDLKEGSVIVIEGRSYKVHSFRRIDDGMLKVVEMN